MGRGLNHKKLAHDLLWGRRLQLALCYTAAEGFRGEAKDQGFTAWLKKHNIPRRKAYRLMTRYKQMQEIMWHAEHDNEKFQAQLEKEYPPKNVDPEIVAALRALRDRMHL
jgi:hypothetical protein